eukprot:scaffold104897_cov72-Phaeocystis_antarctica.AAC.6
MPAPELACCLRNAFGLARAEARCAARQPPVCSSAACLHESLPTDSGVLRRRHFAAVGRTA